MGKLAAGEPQGDGEEPGRPIAAQSAAVEAMASGMLARVRWLMIISGLTTLLAIGAVVSVIGYRVVRTGSGATFRAEGIILVPKGARVIASSVADDRIVVTLDIAGTTEIRTFDLKTLKETGRLRFATEP
jgi:hypothetical protein